MRVCIIGHQGKAEAFRNNTKIAQGKLTFIELAVGDALLDQLVNQLLDLLRRRFGQTARGAFDDVRQADDRALFRLRFRPGITETFLAHLGNVFFAHVHDLAAGARVVLLLQGALIEVIDQRSAVVFLDNVGDAVVELVLEGEIHAFLHVRNDDQGAHRRSEIVVRIPLKIHVLGEIIGLHQFADIVEIGANAAERCVGADRFGRGLGEIRHDQAMVISARRLDRHAAEKRVVQIRGFQPRNVGGDLEELLKHRKRPADDHGGQDSIADGVGALQADHSPIIFAEREKIDWADQAEGEG